MPDSRWEAAAMVVRLASQVTEDVLFELAQRGFEDLRPAHTFALVRISDGDARTADVADHIGITKQGAAQMVEYLAGRGYLTREPDARDARSRLLVLTERGRAYTVAVEAAASGVVDGWRSQLTPADFNVLLSALRVITRPGRARPSW